MLWSSQSYLEYEILYIDHICIGKATLETTTVHRGLIYQFFVRRIYWSGSSESIGHKTGKSQLCAVCQCAGKSSAAYIHNHFDKVVAQKKLNKSKVKWGEVNSNNLTIPLIWAVAVMADQLCVPDIA